MSSLDVELQNSDLTPEDKADLLAAWRQARARLLKRHIFYGGILLRLKCFPTNSGVLVAAVSWAGLHLSGHPKTGFQTRAQTEQDFILLHEIWHLIRDDLSTDRQTYRPFVANVSQDAVINRGFVNDPMYSRAVPRAVVWCDQNRVRIGDNPVLSWSVPDAKQKDWVAIYHDLESQIPPEVERAYSAAIGDVLYSSGSPLDRALSKATIRQAYQEAKSFGEAPADQELAWALEEPQVHWATILRTYLEELIGSEDYGWQPNSRKAHLGTLPRLQPEEGIELVLALDSSGSMVDIISEGVTELRGARQVSKCRVHLVICDAAVHSYKTYEEDEEPDWMNLPVEGGGGTSFVPVFDLIQAEQRLGKISTDALLVFFTDLYGQFPKEEDQKRVETLWVTNSDVVPPFGRTLRTNTKG